MKAGMVLALSLVLTSALLSAKGQKFRQRLHPPQVISTVEPSYPVNAVPGGTVFLEVRADASGEINGMCVSRESRSFTQQAIEAVRQWKFQPPDLDGKHITASVPVAFSFSQPIIWWNRHTK